MSRPTAFLDRDGTIIRDYHFMGSPETVELVPGAAAAVRRLNESGWPVVIVTNQSGIARGYFTEADYERVRDRFEALLAEQGAHVDASYMCPHHPDFTPSSEPLCECRKPGTLLFRRAGTELDLDLSMSWYVGDKLRDVLPAAALGGRGILVPNEGTPPDEIARARKEFSVAGSLDEAVDRIIESAR
ncbi:MAG TPA: HAD family hydrolase [Gemmatimonadaceae bacterium]|nr:HAD family hydrolase [Gemmatimonadaceae bacterium]